VLADTKWGVINSTRALMPTLMQQNETHDVNTTSITDHTTATYTGQYNTSKHAVVALSETLNHEMALMAPQVKVSVLCPGWVKTRIAESARNRPSGGGSDEAAEANAGLILKTFIDRGMPPEELAPQVLSAIRG